MHVDVRFIDATTADELAEVRALFGELAQLDLAHMRRLGLNERDSWELVFHSGEEPLPGDYAPPGGRLVIAQVDGSVAGCGAIRCFSDDACEMKRVFVRDAFRGEGIGRAIATSLVATATAAGYRRMWLDTTTYLTAAIALYESLGFRRCSPYYEIPAGLRSITICMERRLRA